MLRRSRFSLLVVCFALVQSYRPSTAAENESATVPALTGLTAKKAKAAISDAGLVAEFHVGKPARKADDAFKIYDVQPRPGARLAKGSTVKVTVYAGPASILGSSNAVVPPVLGQSAQEARLALTAAGLVVRFHVGKSANTPADAMRVYACDPKPGTQLKPGADVHVTIHPQAAGSIASGQNGSSSLAMPAPALPKDVADAVAALEAQEKQLIRKPPKNLTAAQLDKQFADLRWKIAQKLGTYDIPGAISYAKASVQLDPTHANRWDQLGDLCNLSGEVTSAIDAGAAYKKALEVEPTRHNTRLKLACAYLMMQRPDLAIKHLELYLAATDEQADPQAVGLYATACIAAGEQARGIAFCQAHVDNGGNNRYRLAWAIIEKSRGKKDAAVKLLDDAAKSESKSSPLSAYAADLRRSYLAGK